MVLITGTMTQTEAISARSPSLSSAGEVSWRTRAKVLYDQWQRPSCDVKPAQGRGRRVFKWRAIRRKEFHAGR